MAAPWMMAPNGLDARLRDVIGVIRSALAHSGFQLAE